jgi:hypothetical protein
MKALPAILAATFLVAGTSLALAGGDTTARPTISKRGDDTNPSASANPAAGNAFGKKAMHQAKPMMSKPVSATHLRYAKTKRPVQGMTK